jgi:hypothetical protein
MRRALRGLALAGGWLLAFLVVTWLGARLWALHVVRTAVPEFEARHGSLDRAQWRRELPPPTENGAQYLRAAALLFDRSDEGWKRLSNALEASGGDPLPDSFRAEVEALTADNHDALTLLRQGAAKPRCVFYDELPTPFEIMPNWLAFLNFARLEGENARVALASGDDATAAARLIELSRVADCLEHETIFIVRVVGRGIERRSLARLREALASSRLDASLSPLADSLVHEPLPSIESLARSEAASFGPAAWWRRDDFAPRENESSPLSPFNVEGYTGAWELKGLGEALDNLDSAHPPAEKHEVWVASGQIRPWWENLARTYWINDRRDRSMACVRALARAALAARRAGLALGRYPDRLDEAGTALGPTPLVGEHVVYERTDDGGARLSLPRSQERWTEIEADLPEPARVDFVWTLPPLPAPRTSAGGVR